LIHETKYVILERGFFERNYGGLKVVLLNTRDKEIKVRIKTNDDGSVTIFVKGDNLNEFPKVEEKERRY